MVFVVMVPQGVPLPLRLAAASTLMEHVVGCAIEDKVRAVLYTAR